MNTLTKLDANRRSVSIDLSTMDVELNLEGANNKNNKTFDSYSSITFIPKVSETFIDIIAENIEQVSINGHIVKCEYDGSKLYLKNLIPNTKNIVTICAKCKYSITGEGLHRYFDPQDSNCYLYTHYEPTDARRVYACFDQPDLKAHWNITVTAPKNWIVLSNSSKKEQKDSDTTSTHIFKTTPKLSSYITAIVAGNYHSIKDEYYDTENKQKIELGLYCRKSLAHLLDYDDFFYVTKQGLKFYNKHYDYPYPWGKYDQILVPEYNIGAMENPGCVTFSEKTYLFKSTPTFAGKQARANTILHEMCHMWFGDLVTPKWWDDLWLKESFADHQGTFVTASATKYKQAWATFACKRKAWAYKQDSLSTTHPILADIVDVDAAKENFDGITYAKGASVLKQLVAWVGEEDFFKVASQYFKKNAYKNTSLKDLTISLKNVSNKDFDNWIEKWLNTTNVSILSPNLVIDNDEITSLSIQQKCVTVKGEKVLRPHQIKVGFYKYNSDKSKLEKYHIVNVELIEELTNIENIQGLTKPDILVVNDEDLTYAITRLDPTSLENAIKSMHLIDDDLTRSILWSSIFNQVSDRILSTEKYLTALYNNLAYEENDAIVQTVLEQTLNILNYMKPGKARQAIVNLAEFARNALKNSKNYDLKKVWANAYVDFMLKMDLQNFTKAKNLHVKRLMQLLNNEFENFKTDKQLKWKIARVLYMHDFYSINDLDEMLKVDPSGDGKIGYLKAKSSFISKSKKLELFQQITTDNTLSNEQLLALIEGFNTGISDSEKLYFASKYFEIIEQVWNSKTIVMAKHIINGLYPKIIDSNDIPEYNPIIVMTTNWLTSNLQAPHVLRKLIIENNDLTLKALRCRSIN